MKIKQNVILLERGAFATSPEWVAIRVEIHAAIETAEWPVGAGSFKIYPESGKKSGQGNGVVPIKAKPMSVLAKDGWTLEYPWTVAGKSTGLSGKGTKPGNIDAAKDFPAGLVVVEWETGNISSSHRAVNKMALGLILRKCIAGVLVVPNMKLAQYLTDRIGNIEELLPYAPMWRALDLKEGVLELVVIEQDADDLEVPRIPKGQDGRAKEGADKVKKKRRKSRRKLRSKSS